MTYYIEEMPSMPSVHFSFSDIWLGLNHETLSKVTEIVVRSDTKIQPMTVAEPLVCQHLGKKCNMLIKETNMTDITGLSLKRGVSVACCKA